MLGTRTRGANESTELWRHPLPLFLFVSCYFISHHFLYFFWWSVGMSVLVSLLMSELILISKMFQFPSNLRLCRCRRRRHHNWCLSILPHRHQWKILKPTKSYKHYLVNSLNTLAKWPLRPWACNPVGKSQSGIFFLL